MQAGSRLWVLFLKALRLRFPWELPFLSSWKWLSHQTSYQPLLVPLCPLPCIFFLKSCLGDGTVPSNVRVGRQGMRRPQVYYTSQPAGMLSRAPQKRIIYERLSRQLIPEEWVILTGTYLGSSADARVRRSPRTVPLRECASPTPCSARIYFLGY